MKMRLTERGYGCLTVLAALLLAGMLLLFRGCMIRSEKKPTKTAETAATAAAADIPESLLALMERNPETEEFVLAYPEKKDETFTVDLSEEAAGDGVPLLLQWDERWGYETYGDDVLGITGCGPTCLSMCCLYLLRDPVYSPAYLARFSTENGYCVPGDGTAWTLFGEGAEQLGLDVTEIPLDEERVMKNLRVGNPVVCIMGPGDFTDDGHFIVLAGEEDGLLIVNDPNSRIRSGKRWSFSEIADQIRNLWVLRVC